MTIPMLFLFITDMAMAQQNPYRFSIRDIKELMSTSDESAILSSVDYSDPFCKENKNAIFRDLYEYNIYYRCRRNRRETWKCIGDLYFDRKNQRCSPVSTTEVDVRLTETIEVCYQQEDGLYPLYDTNCKKYVRCKEGVVVEEKECGANELFSFSLQSCRGSYEVKCIRSLCELSNDGFFVLPGSKCQAYYLCRKGVRYDFLCPRGQIFDVVTKHCVDGGICYEQTCIGRTDGVYPDTTHDCNRYFRCKGGELTETTSCPKSFKHNGFTCAPSSKVNCEKPEKTAIPFYNRINDECKLLRDGSHIIKDADCAKIRICSRGRTTGVSECPKGYRFQGSQCYPRNLIQCEDSCSEKPDGYYADEQKACREYYHCFNGKIKERKKCENGLSFNGKVCFPSSLVACGKQSESEEAMCEGLQNGYHADYLNGCGTYFYCHNQQIITMNTCPEGKRWNGSECVNKDEYKCDLPQVIPRCKGEITGLHQDLSSNCKNYIYCKNGEGTVLTCKDEEVYDGVRCRHSNEYTCPSVIRDECYNQPDGYMQDEKSNCRSYIFCSRGSKIIYICSGNFVFNGTHCVSPKEYTCPKSSDECEGKLNGYYPDGGAGCKKYFYCLEGKRTTTLSCGGKKIFNGEACVLANDSKGTCKSITENLCYRRIDGIYGVRKPQCEGHVECRNQVLIKEQCNGSSAFNETICSGGHSCSSEKDKVSCGSNRFQFIPDYGSGCRNYYFCVGNLKMLATCPNGTIFNGKVCQGVNSYNCPKGNDSF